MIETVCLVSFISLVWGKLFIYPIYSIKFGNLLQDKPCKLFILCTIQLRNLMPVRDQVTIVSTNSMVKMASHIKLKWSKSQKHWMKSPSVSESALTISHFTTLIWFNYQMVLDTSMRIFQKKELLIFKSGIKFSK